MGSPSTVVIVPGAGDYLKTTAAGPGRVDPVAGIAAEFEIQAKDAEGNDKITGGDVFEVTVRNAANDDGEEEVHVVTPVYAGAGKAPPASATGLGEAGGSTAGRALGDSQPHAQRGKARPMDDPQRHALPFRPKIVAVRR